MKSSSLFALVMICGFVLLGASALSGCATLTDSPSQAATANAAEPAAGSAAAVASNPATAPKTSASSDASSSLPKRTKQISIPGQYLPGLDDCENNETRRGFTQSITAGDVPCFEGTQTCIGGNWVGPHLFLTCENFTKSCDGRPHGSTKHGYQQMSAPKSTGCQTAMTTCLNGSWTGAPVYDTCTEF